MLVSPISALPSFYFAKCTVLLVVFVLRTSELASRIVTSTVKDTFHPETVGYVIKGRAELQLEGQVVLLQPGDSWVVPKGSSHTYKILEPFTAVEATSPPALVHGRDDARSELKGKKTKTA
jgi:hypothetical protein